MYKLNSDSISKNRVNELIDDLAMYPLNPADIEMPIKERKAHYLAILQDTGELKISSTLTIFKK